MPVRQLQHQNGRPPRSKPISTMTAGPCATITPRAAAVSPATPAALARFPATGGSPGEKSQGCETFPPRQRSQAALQALTSRRRRYRATSTPTSSPAGHDARHAGSAPGRSGNSADLHRLPQKRGARAALAGYRFQCGHGLDPTGRDRAQRHIEHPARPTQPGAAEKPAGRRSPTVRSVAAVINGL